MNIKELIDKDPRVIDLRQKYQQALAKKNQMILAISHIESDIIKMMGQFETISNEIIASTRPAPVQPPAPPVTPVEVPESAEEVDGEGNRVIPEENQDDGFAHAKECKCDGCNFDENTRKAQEEVQKSPDVIIPPSAENTNPPGSQE